MIITSGQPSANPRVVKEARALADAGYEVSVVYNPLSPWADVYDQELFSFNSNIRWIVAGWKPTDEFRYRFARLRRKVYEILWRNAKSNALFALRAHVLFSQELEKESRKVKADLYIAHNIGALPIAVKIAKRFGATAGFDAEDYHRGEDVQGSLHWTRIKTIEDCYIPELKYVSAASPAILEAYRNLYKPPFTFYVPNVVEYLPGQNQKPETSTVKLFWFSQVIGKQRGLENAIKAIASLKGQDIELHLAGNVDGTMKAFLHQTCEASHLPIEKLHFTGVLSPKELIDYANKVDIGLAMESNWCESRNLCETNKIFSYLASGLAIIFSDTIGQNQFWEKHSNIGLIYHQDDASSLAKAIKTYIEQPELLQQHKANASKLAIEKYNWYHEGKVFTQKIKEVLAR